MFDGFGVDSHPKGAEKNSDDLPQSKVGPGGFPGENTFTPHGQQGSGYARADTQPIPAAPAPPEAAKNVAEAYRITPGNASARADFTLFVQGDTNGGSLTFFFTATPFMRVKTTNEGDQAEADLEVELNVLFDPEGDAPRKPVFVWVPCGDKTNPRCFGIIDPSLSVGGITDPFDLNETITCKGGPCEKTWPADGTEKTHNYEITVNGFGKGTVTAGLDSHEGVSLRAREVRVPEPSTLPLMLCGAIGLAITWLRRSRGRKSANLDA